MNSLVWVQPNTAGEPAWTAGGSYFVVRLIRMLVEFWDRVDDHRAGEHDRPAPRLPATRSTPTASTPRRTTRWTPTGDVIPLTAHMRLANPRTPQTADSRILRRAYNYDRGHRPGRRPGHRAGLHLFPAGHQAAVRSGADAADRRAARRLHQPVRRRLLPGAARRRWTAPTTSAARCWPECEARPRRRARLDRFLTVRLPFWSDSVPFSVIPLCEFLTCGARLRAPAARPGRLGVADSAGGRRISQPAELRRVRWAKAQHWCRVRRRRPGTSPPSAHGRGLGAGAAVGHHGGAARAPRRTPSDCGGRSRRPRPGDGSSPTTTPRPHADQARRGDLRRERVVRPLLRHLPVRGEHRRHPVRRQAGHADGQRPVQRRSPRTARSARC